LAAPRRLCVSLGSERECRYAGLVGPSRALTGWLRADRPGAHHANHGVHGVVIASTLLILPIGLAAVTSMIVHGERLPMPFSLWVAVTALTATTALTRWAAYRKLLGARFLDWLLGSLATASLAHVVLVANLTAILGRPATWQRTDKFRRPRRGLRALAAARTETILSACFLATGALGIGLAPQGGLTAMLAIGLILRGVQYATAPVLTLIADRAAAIKVNPHLNTAPSLAAAWSPEPAADTA
jgi:hypothetical protein